MPNVAASGPVDIASAVAVAMDSRHWRELLDLLPAPVYTTDAKGNLTYFNKAAATMSGRTPELGTDRWCVTWKLYHPDGRPMPHDECPMAICLKERREVRGHEAIAERPDGTRFWFEPHPTPLFDAEGGFIGGINVLLDITERKNAERERARESECLAKLNELSSRLWRTPTLHEGLDEMLSATIELLGADMGNVQLFDSSRGVLMIEAQCGFAQPFLDFFREVGAADDSACGRALRAGTRLIVEDVESDSAFAPMREVARAAGFRAVQSTPLIGRDGAPLGMLSTHFAAVHRPNEQALHRLDLYARQAVDFIERKANEDALRLREAIMAHQREALELAIGDAPLETSLAVLVRSAIESIGQGARAGFYLANEAKTTLHHVVGMPPEYAEAVDGFTVGPDSLACGLATHTGKPVLTSDVRNDPLWQPWLWMAEKFGYRACWSFPIRSTKESFIGTLAVYSREPREATPRDIEICGLISRAASLIISRQKDTNARRQMQQILRESDERHRQTLALMPAAVYSCDASGLITYHNDRAAELWGRAPKWGDTDERFCGSELMILPDGTPLPHEKCPMAIALADGTSYRNTEVSIRRPDGSLVHVMVNIDPIRNEQGEIIGAINAFHDVSALKQAQHAMRESETRFHSLFESMDEGYCVIEVIFDGSTLPVDFRFLEVNPAFEKQTGLKNVSGRLVRDILPDVERNWIDTYGRVALNGETLRFENPVAALGRSYDVCAFRVGDPEMRRVGVIFNDITQRKQAEESLRRNAETFAALVEQSPLGIYTVDADFRVANVSVGAVPVFRNVHPLIGRDFAEVMHILWPAPFAQEAIAIFRRTLETGEPYVSPGLTETRKDLGAIESYEWQVNRVTLADGRLGVVCYFFDVTRLQLANQALRESEKRFRMVADNMDQLAWTCDSLGNVTWYNQRWLEYTGLSFEEMKGWDWSKVHHPDHLERVVGTVRRAAESGETWEDTFPLRGKDGRYRWFLSRAVPIRNESGGIVNWFGTNTDVTQLKELEDERGKMLAQEAALRIQAESATRAKDRFLAVLSHELRTPLSPVVMAVAGMETAADLPYALREDVAMIRRNIELEVRLIDDLLDLSRVTSGKMRLQVQPTRLHPVLQQAVHNCASDTAAKRLSLRVELHAENDRVNADPARLQQVFWNLIRNAAKFTPESGDILIRSSCVDGNVRVEVRDTGIGISSEYLPAVFDAFVQAEGPATHQFGGLGLGLAICKAIVDMHGGSIRAHSEGAGKGATFTVELPGATSTVLVSNGDAAPSGGINGNAQLRILLVEDHADSARLLARHLDRSGYVVRTAANVSSALQLAATEAFDIVVSDIGLPDGTGYDLMRQIRERHAIKGIALSGYGMEDDLRRSREAGFIDHVIKPVSVPHLDAVIRRVAHEENRG